MFQISGGQIVKRMRRRNKRVVPPMLTQPCSTAPEHRSSRDRCGLTAAVTAEEIAEMGRRIWKKMDGNRFREARDSSSCPRTR
jgi:hypothetical protein